MGTRERGGLGLGGDTGPRSPGSPRVGPQQHCPPYPAPPRLGLGPRAPEGLLGSAALTGSGLGHRQVGANLGFLGAGWQNQGLPCGFGTGGGVLVGKNQEEAFKVILRAAKDPRLGLTGQLCMYETPE